MIPLSLKTGSFVSSEKPSATFYVGKNLRFGNEYKETLSHFMMIYYISTPSQNLSQNYTSFDNHLSRWKIFCGQNLEHNTSTNYGSGTDSARAYAVLEGALY